VNFGLIVIGDEILSGRRRDRHVEFFRGLLAGHGHALHWVQILPDDPALLTGRLRQTMDEGKPVFSCGGIGATPDDHTRRCAAEAAGVRCAVLNPQMYPEFPPFEQLFPDLAQHLEARFRIGREIRGGQTRWLGLVRRSP